MSQRNNVILLFTLMMIFVISDYANVHESVKSNNYKTINTHITNITTDSAIIDEIIADKLSIKYTIYDDISIEMNNMINKKVSNYIVGPYKMSNKGINFIKKHEQLVLHSYNINHERYNTIGYGHQILPGENIPNTISERRANKILQDDIEKVNKSINRLMGELNPKLKVTQGFIDGLGSLIFNCGEQGTRTTRFFERLKRCRFDKNGNINKKDFEYALEGVKISRVYLKGHKIRRKDEYTLMTVNNK